MSLLSRTLLLSLTLVVQSQATRSPQLIYQFPNATFVGLENIAVRSNGHLLLNLITAPTVMTINPNEPDPKPLPIHTFAGATSMTGIAQVASDVFAVVVGNYTVAKHLGIPTSFSIWTIDFNYGCPIAEKIASIPEAHALNGMTTVDGTPGVVLVADSDLGALFLVNVTSGSYHIAIQDPSLAKSALVPLGVNGIHTRAKTLYFTNSALRTFGSFPIAANGSSVGAFTSLAHLPGGVAYDDFAIDSNGTSWITNHPYALDTVTLDGQQTTVVNTTSMVQPVSAAFGVGTRSCALYVATAGMATNTSITSGQVFKLHTC